MSASTTSGVPLGRGVDPSASVKACSVLRADPSLRRHPLYLAVLRFVLQKSTAVRYKKGVIVYPTAAPLVLNHPLAEQLRGFCKQGVRGSSPLGSTIRATRCASPRARKHDTTSRCDDLMSSARESHDINSTGAEMMRSPWAYRHTPM